MPFKCAAFRLASIRPALIFFPGIVTAWTNYKIRSNNTGSGAGGDNPRPSPARKDGTITAIMLAVDNENFREALVNGGVLVDRYWQTSWIPTGRPLGETRQPC